LRSFNAGEIGKEMTAAERAAHAEEVEASRAWMAQRGLSPDDAARAIVANWAAGAGPDPDETITLDEVLANVRAATGGVSKLLAALLAG
jgi:hypothetical protein